MSNNKRHNVGLTASLIWFAFLVAAFIGWFMNIFAIFGMIDGGFTAMFVARLVGIFVFPFGAILGWFA